MQLLNRVVRKNNMLSLYIHIPYCVRKCPYCGFYSTEYTQQNADEYIAALRREASCFTAAFNNRVFHSVYIGGGTPTTLASGQIEEVLNIVSNCFAVAADGEVTVEGNPNTVTAHNLSMFRRHGVNRLSLGVQSFSDEVLRTLGRLHTSARAVDAFCQARIAGFANIGIDLIYGIHGQSMAQWRESLDRAVKLRPEHVAAYSLSLDDGSLFKKQEEAGELALPDDDAVADMYECAATLLGRAGYRRYEISNFSLPGFECRHNMNYWERGEYLGLGPGAWSFHAGRRYRNISDTREYAQRLADGKSVAVDCEMPGPEQSSLETVMLSLRTAKGLDLLRYRHEYGLGFLKRLETNMAPLKVAGLIRVAEGRVMLTDRGILLSNDALSRLCE